MLNYQQQMLACFLCIVIVAENLRNQLKQHSARAAVESNSHLAFYYAMVIANFPALYPVMFLYEFSINYNVVFQLDSSLQILC